MFSSYGFILMLIWGFIFMVMVISMISVSLGLFSVYTLEWKVLSLFSDEFSLVIILDMMSMILAGTVMMISASVFTFSKFYFHGEEKFNRFHFTLFLFVVSMLILIFSPGLFSMFIGWDGLGLTSFLLVMHYSNSNALNSAILTVITNRLGDAAMLTSIVMGVDLGSFNPISMHSPVVTSSKLLIFLFILGAMTKSAQMPFSAWLPAAMAAPTPVSSLVHSSTLVTAGVYVLIRLSFHLDYFYKWLLLVGGLTTLMAGMSALKESDMKKIVALSTLSQLGIMFTALGMGSPVLSFFHLIVHAFFKALMFISVGGVIHVSSGFQSLKIMGGRIKSLPLSGAFLVSSSVSLCGLPFFSGFFSKEMILDSLSIYSSTYFYIYFYLLSGVILTFLYSTILIFKVLTGNNNFLSLNKQIDSSMTSFCSGLMLLIPGITGGMFMLIVLSYSLKFSLSPSLPQNIIFDSFFVVVAMTMRGLAITWSSPAKVLDVMFYLWGAPGGQISLFYLKNYPSMIYKKDMNYYLDGAWVFSSANLFKIFLMNVSYGKTGILRSVLALGVFMVLLTLF